MPQIFCKCGSPATAARLYPETTNRPICVDCASIDRLRIDPVPECSVPVPDHPGGSRPLTTKPYTREGMTRMTLKIK